MRHQIETRFDWSVRAGRVAVAETASVQRGSVLRRRIGATRTRWGCTAGEPASPAAVSRVRPAPARSAMRRTRAAASTAAAWQVLPRRLRRRGRATAHLWRFRFYLVVASSPAGSAKSRPADRASSMHKPVSVRLRLRTRQRRFDQSRRGAIAWRAESDTCLVVVTVFKIVAPTLCAGGWVRFPPSPPSLLAQLA
jgi:hypothetical protein